MESFESSVIATPHCVLGIFLDLGKDGSPLPPPPPADLDLSEFDLLQDLVPGVQVVLINYNVKEVSLEYNVRRRLPSPGKWKSFLWWTRSRNADQIMNFEGALELSEAVNAMLEDKPGDAEGNKLKTTLALGGAEPEEPDL